MDGTTVVSSRERVIKKILPHRKRWLQVDKILELGDNSITAVRTFNEKDCEGHFPQPIGPMVPGHLIAEALAQTGGLLLGSQESSNGKIPYLVISEMKFHSPTYPFQVVTLEAKISERKLGITFFDVRAQMGKKLLAKGKIGVMLQEFL